MQTKGVWLSKTFWGALVSLLAMFAPKFFEWIGVPLDPSGQGMLVDHILAGLSFLFTVYGRITATDKVSLTGN